LWSMGLRRRGAALFAAVFVLLPFTRATQTAIANGDTRTLELFHAHTHESLRITYKRDGQFDSAALEKLNWFLRDWRVDEPTSMAPGLFDVVWAVYQEVGASEPIKVVSAYRSPGTNAMLRRRSRAVAKESQHIRGNAMDVHIPGVSMAKAREIGMRLQRGGVGYYPTAGSPFVHLDIGSVRSWPRMPRDQLERLFPDGKTVHLPADGIPLANYQAALAEVQARGGSALDYNTVTTSSGKTLWALLFGGEEEDDAPPASGWLARGRGVSQPSLAQGFSAAPPASGPDQVMVANVVPDVLARATPVLREAAPLAPKPADIAPVEVKATPPLLEIAALPVPPIRPRGLSFEQLGAAAEPLPPIRPKEPAPQPVSLAEASLPGLEEKAPLRVAGLPVPPARPADEAALPLQRVSLPTPPLRGVAVEAPAIQIAAASPAPQTAKGPAALVVQPAIDPAARHDRRVLVAAAPAAHIRPDHVVVVAEPEVSEALGSAVVAMRFTKAAPRDGRAGFDGGFIRPLGASFMAPGG